MKQTQKIEIEKIVEKIINENNQQAKDRFCKNFRPPLLSFIKKRIKHKQDAEDIVQETLISALNSLPSFNFKSSTFSWLCAIANHEIADFYRKEKIKTIIFSKSRVLEKVASQALGPEKNCLKQELKLEIKNVLKSLNEGYFKILRLKYIEQLPMKIIAKQMDITVKAVESRLFRARKKFKQKWQQRDLENLSQEFLKLPS